MIYSSVPYYVCKSLGHKGLQKDLTRFLDLLCWKLGSGGSTGDIPTVRTIPTGT